MIVKRLIYEFPYIMLGALIIFFLYTHSPNLEYDVDPSYVLFGATRPPLYPTFIWLFHWAGSYQFSLVIWVQGILIFAALLYTRFWLRRNLQVSDFPIFLVCLFVICTISLHFQIWFVQSEGLSFPLFIFTFFLLLECFQKLSLRKLLYLALLVNLLVLTRLQFYYFYAIFVLLCIWHLWQGVPIKSIVYSAFILFGTMLITTVVDYSYHYYKHGFFAGEPYGGLLILVQTLYLADSNAASYFQDPVEKEYVQKMIDQRNAQQLNQDASLTASLKPSFYEYAYQSYSRNFLAIQRIIENTLNTSIENSFGKETNFNSNTVAINIDKTLISHELKRNLFFFLWKFAKCMGGIPLLLFFIIISVSLPIKIIKDKIRDPSFSLIFCTMISIITIFNAAMIAVCNPDLPVYFCYSQFMFYCLAAFIMSKAFERDASHPQ